MGYIAGGLLPAGRLAEQIVAARALTSGPLGVNLFVPQPTTGTPGRFAAYAKALAGEAEHYGVGLGEPHHSDDDWAAKLDLMHDLRPEVVSFTFGLPTIDECRRLKSAGTTSGRFRDYTSTWNEHRFEGIASYYAERIVINGERRTRGCIPRG
jgi:nitronate monooxygenase